MSNLTNGRNAEEMARRFLDGLSPETLAELTELERRGQLAEAIEQAALAAELVVECVPRLAADLRSAVRPLLSSLKSPALFDRRRRGLPHAFRTAGALVTALATSEDVRSGIVA